MQSSLACLALAAAILGSACGSTSSTQDARDPERARVLIVTGEDYAGHDWKATTPVLAAAIAADPRLEVDVHDDLTTLGALDLTPYAALVLHFKNYDPAVPGRPGLDALVRHAEAGSGLVLVHFACGAFEEFRDEYAELVGRIWFGAQPPPGRHQHDPHGAFTVEVADSAHPITCGLADFETTDELYTCLEGDVPVEVLFEGLSVRDGVKYPLAFVHHPGAGRVFHCVLGHDTAALENPPVAELYRRGTAWAAGLDPVASARTDP